MDLETIILRTITEQQISDVVMFVAEKVYKKVCEPVINKGWNYFKTQYEEQIRPKLDENIRENLDAFIRDVDNVGLVECLKERYNSLVDQIRDKVSEYISKKLSGLLFFNFGNVTKNYNISTIDKTIARCPIIVMLDIDSGNNSIDHNYILSAITRILKQYDSATDITVCSYDNSNKPFIYQELISVRDYGERVYLDTNNSNGEVIKFGRRISSHINKFYNNNKIRHKNPFFVYITNRNLFETNKNSEKMERFCQKNHYGFCIINIGDMNRDENRIADDIVKNICTYLNINSGSPVEVSVKTKVDSIPKGYVEDQCFQNRQRCYYSLALDFNNPDADAHKNVMWNSFFNVFRLENDSSRGLGDASVTINNSILSECSKSEKILGYHVTVSGQAMLMKCLQCEDPIDAKNVLEYYEEIFKQCNQFGVIYDKKLVITNEKKRRCFAVIFMKYPDEESWISLRSFIEEKGDNYKNLSIMQRCSMVYQVAYAVKNLTENTGKCGLIGGQLTRNNVYISRNLDLNRPNIQPSSIFIGGLGLPSENKQLNDRALKDLLCFCLTASYSCEREKLGRLPCYPVLRDYFSKVCAQDNESFFDEYNQDGNKFKLIYDDTTGVKFNNTYDIGLLSSSGIKRIGILDVNSGVYSDCINCVYTTEGFVTIKFYRAKGDENREDVVKVYLDGVDSSNNVVLLNSNNPVNKYGVIIYNEDEIEFTATKLLGKRTKKIKITNIEII